MLTIEGALPLTASSLQRGAPWLCESGGQVYAVVNSSVQAFGGLPDLSDDLLRHVLAAGAQLCFLTEEFTSIMQTERVEPDRVFADLWESSLMDSQAVVDGIPVACVVVRYRAIEFLVPRDPITNPVLLARRQGSESGWPPLVSATGR